MRLPKRKTRYCVICGKTIELKQGQLNMCCNINYQNGDLLEVFEEK